ncbi:MAG: hypothetical protein ABSE51_24450 [Terracidiphilus sp.]|jgi:hypothetical protein
MDKIYRAKFDDFPATGVSGWVVADCFSASVSALRVAIESLIVFVNSYAL